MNDFVAAFLVASGIAFWLIVLFLAGLVVVAVIRGVNNLQVERAAQTIGDQAEQYLREEAGQ